MAKELIDIDELFKFIYENAEGESILLTPYPTAHIELKSLLDKIAELRNKSKDENGEYYNNICDIVDSEKLKKNYKNE